jgi:hypothetical protein
MDDDRVSDAERIGGSGDRLPHELVRLMIGRVSPDHESDVASAPQLVSEQPCGLHVVHKRAAQDAPDRI